MDFGAVGWMSAQWDRFRRKVNIQRQHKISQGETLRACKAMMLLKELMVPMDI